MGIGVISGVLSSIGNTPIVKLNKAINEFDFELYAKLEFLNPSGSAKDRSALSMLYNAFKNGHINQETTIIESSSGNLGIAIAQICSIWGLKFICVIDPKTTKHNLKLLESYGAQIDCVNCPDAVTGEYLQARIMRVNQLLIETPNSYRPNQYSNIYNPRGHQSLAKEIEDYFTHINKHVDYIFCPTSTCGTIRGIREHYDKVDRSTKIIAVDAIGSVIFGGERGKRKIPGHGAAIVPELYYNGIADDVIYISDAECVCGCRHLLETEGILGGGSSGAAFSAIKKYAASIKPKSICVMLIYDRGERYLDTIYSDAWIKSTGLI